MSKIMIAVIALVVIVPAFFIWVLTYGFPWKRWSSEWAIKKGEEISSVMFTVGDKVGGDKLSAVVYLEANKSYKKLPSQDAITLNGQPMRAEYYNTGEAVGYKYTAEVDPAKEYALSIKREGDTETRKVVVPRTLTPVIPSQISKKQLSIPYAEGAIPDDAVISFYVASSQPSGNRAPTGNGAYFAGGIDGNAMVLGNGGLEYDPYFKNKPESLAKFKKETEEEFQQLPNGKAVLTVVVSFDQEGGTYFTEYKKEVDIVD